MTEERPLKDIRNEAAQQQQNLRELLHENYHKRESLVQDLIDFQNEAIKKKRHIYIGEPEKKVKVNEEEDEVDDKQLETDLQKASGNISKTIENMTNSLQRIHQLRNTFHQAVGQAEKGFVMKGKLKAIKMDLESTTTALTQAKQETELMRELVKEKEELLVKKLRKQESVRKRIEQHIERVNNLYRRQDDTLRHLLLLARYKNLSIKDFEKMYKKCSQAYLSTLGNSLTQNMSKEEKKRLTYALDKLHERHLKDQSRIHTNKYNRKDQEFKELWLNEEKKGIQHYKRLDHFIDTQLEHRTHVDRRKYYRKKIRKKTPPQTTQNVAQEKTIKTGMTQATVKSITDTIKKQKRIKRKRRAISVLTKRQKIHFPLPKPTKRPSSVSLSIAQRRAKLWARTTKQNPFQDELMDARRSIESLKKGSHRDEAVIKERSKYLSKLLGALSTKLEKAMEESAITNNVMPVPERLLAREKALNEKLSRIERSLAENRPIQMSESIQMEIMEELQQVYYEKTMMQLRPGDPLKFKKESVVILDVHGSMDLYRQDPVTTTLALEMVSNSIYELLKKYGGHVMAQKQSLYMIHFDSTVSAVQFATQIQLKLHALHWPAKLLNMQEAREEYYRGTLIFRGLRLKIGIHVGVSVTDDTYLYGPVIEIASQLMRLCPVGEIVVSGLTWRAIRSFDLTTHYDCPIYSKYLGTKTINLTANKLIDTLRSLTPRALIRRSYFNHQVADLSYGDIHDMQANINAMLELVHPLLNKGETTPEKHSVTVSILRDSHAQIGQFLHRYGHTTREDSVSLNKKKLSYLNTKVAHIRIANTKFKRSFQSHSKEINQTLSSTIQAMDKWRFLTKKNTNSMQHSQEDMDKREQRIREKEEDMQVFLKEKARLGLLEKTLNEEQKKLAHQQEMVRKVKHEMAEREKDIDSKFKELENTLSIIEEAQQTNAQERQDLEEKSKKLEEDGQLINQLKDQLMVKAKALKIDEAGKLLPKYEFQFKEVHVQTNEESHEDIVNHWELIEKVVKTLATQTSLGKFNVEHIDGVFKKLVARVIDQLNIPDKKTIEINFKRTLFKGELSDIIKEEVDAKVKAALLKKKKKQSVKKKKTLKKPKSARKTTHDKTKQLLVKPKEGIPHIVSTFEKSEEEEEDDDEDEGEIEDMPELIEDEEEIDQESVHEEDEENDDLLQEDDESEEVVSRLEEEELLSSNPSTPHLRQPSHRRRVKPKKKKIVVTKPTKSPPKDSKEEAISKIENRVRKSVKVPKVNEPKSIYQLLSPTLEDENEPIKADTKLSAFKERTVSALKVDLETLSQMSTSTRSARSNTSSIPSPKTERLPSVRSYYNPYAREPTPPTPEPKRKKVEMKDMSTQTSVIPRAKRALLNKNLYVLSEQYPELTVEELEKKWKALRSSTNRVDMEYYNRLRKRADQLPIDLEKEADLSKIDDDNFFKNIIQFSKREQPPIVSISPSPSSESASIGGEDKKAEASIESDESVVVTTDIHKIPENQIHQTTPEDSRKDAIDEQSMDESITQDQPVPKKMNDQPNINRFHDPPSNPFNDPPSTSPTKQFYDPPPLTKQFHDPPMNDQQQPAYNGVLSKNSSMVDLEHISSSNVSEVESINVSELMDSMATGSLMGSAKRRSKHQRSRSGRLLEEFTKSNKATDPSNNKLHQGNFSTLPLKSTYGNRKVDVGMTTTTPKVEKGGDVIQRSPQALEPPSPSKPPQSPSSIQMELGSTTQPTKKKAKGKIASSGRLKSYLKPGEDNTSIALTSYKDYKRVDVKVNEIITSEESTPMEFINDPTLSFQEYYGEGEKKILHDSSQKSVLKAALSKHAARQRKGSLELETTSRDAVHRIAMELQKRKRAMDHLQRQLDRRASSIKRAEDELNQRRQRLSHYLRHDLPGKKLTKSDVDADAYVFPKFLVTNEANVDHRPSPLSKPAERSLLPPQRKEDEPTNSPLPAIRSPTNYTKQSVLRHHYTKKEEHPEVLMNKLQNTRLDAAKIIDAQEWIANMPIADFKNFFQTVIPKSIATSMLFGPSSLNTSLLSDDASFL